jgi:hypothetical protein
MIIGLEIKERSTSSLSTARNNEDFLISSQVDDSLQFESLFFIIHEKYGMKSGIILSRRP